MVGSADDSKLLTVNGGGGSDTMDASLVTTSSNHVTLLGGAGADTVKFAASNLNSGHTVNGGSDGSVDTLAFTTAGTVLTGAFTNVSHIEALQLADGTNNVAIPDALVASADDGQLLTIFGGSGNDTIDLRSVTNASNSFAVHAGNGNDTIDIVPNQITASDSVDGGAGIDTLALLTLGIAFNPALFPASTFDNVSHIETLAVAPRFHATPDTPTIVTLTDALVSSSDDNHRLTISFGGESLDFKNSQKVDGSGVTTATNTLLFTIGGAGTFDLTGGAGADVFRFDNDGRFGGPTLFSTVTMNGGTGPSLDSIVLSYSGTIDPTALVNTSHIEIVTLANLGPNSITLTDAMVGTADDGQLVTVNGSSYADTIDASQVTTAGNHVTLQGGAGTDSFKLAGGNFNSTDTVDGGSDGATDTLTFVGAAALAADAFANTSHIEILRLDSGTNGISLTDGLVGSADDNHLLKVYGNAGSDTIDASAVTTAANTVVFDSGAGNATLAGGAGNDTAIYTSGFLTFDGGGGINTIDMSRFGSAIWYGFNDPSGIEMWTKDNADYSQPGTDRPLANVANALIVIGTAYSDVINGDGSDNAYVYTGGLDTFNGFGGSNTLDLSRLGSAVWYGHNDPSGIEAWTKDNSDIAQPGTWRAIVDTANVQNVIGTAYNDVINGDQNDDTYIYTGGLDTFDGAGGSNTLDLSRMTAAIWYGYNEKTGIEAWTKDNSDIALPGHAWRAIVDTANVQNVVGTVYNDTISGNGGANRFVGGSGADVLTGGGGGDTFAYGGTADSTSAAYDTIVGFDMASDRFDLPGTVTGIDAAVSSGSLSSASVDADLAAAIGASQMASHHAVLFSPTAGSLAGHTFLIVDANGTAGYQAGQDFVFHLNSPANLASLATSDFV